MQRSQLDNEAAQRSLAKQAAHSSVTQRKAAKSVRQRKGKASARSRNLRQTYLAESGIRVTVTFSRRARYHDIERALQEALDEVRTRIENDVQLY